MMEGAVCLDGEESDRLRLLRARCPAQPWQIRTISGSRFSETACSAINGTNLGVIWGMSVELPWFRALTCRRHPLRGPRLMLACSPQFLSGPEYV
jgi:hypothetical protein